jgi:Zn-finger nucleic acid-binding protein
MLERSAASNVPPSAGTQQSYRHEQKYHDYRPDDQYHKRKKKESFLGDLFDF